MRHLRACVLSLRKPLVVSQTNYDKFIWRNLSDYFVGEHPA